MIPYEFHITVHNDKLTLPGWKTTRFVNITSEHIEVRRESIITWNQEFDNTLNKVMFYLVYKITNSINGKYYIGMHQTTDINDGYMGSGKRLKLAIKKYGIDSFVKEILHVFDNETDMRNKEKELVIISENTYNLCDGGKGGFSYINRSGKNLRTGVVLSDETKKKISESKKGTPHWNKGGTISEETKKKISINTSLALKGTKKSDKHKKNLSEAIKLWHKNKKAGIV